MAGTLSILVPAVITQNPKTTLSNDRTNVLARTGLS
jgi:hypothetical protein